MHGQKKRSNSTVSRYLASLSHVLSIAAKEWQWLTENPCLKVKKPKAPPGRLRYLSKNEMGALFQACQQSKNKYLYLIVLIALTTGARQGEILNLQWTDVDFDNHFLHLRDTKNGENRSVPIAEEIFQMLQQQRKDNGLVFPAYKNPLLPCNIRSAWETALKRANIQDFTFHDIRHTTGSYLTMDGASLREVGEILGHKTMQMTKRYSHLSQEHKRKLVGRMEQLINEEQGKQG
ncbi:MAG TPA: site-specific integrase [Waddliaceae bacterium]